VTLRAWLRGRTPPGPERLLARIEATLGSRCERDAAEATSLCLDAAEELLRDLIARPSIQRDAALDLLTVDALTTFAFEAAAGDPETLTDHTAIAMKRFAMCIPA
jgi:hypothetical protein